MSCLIDRVQWWFVEITHVLFFNNHSISAHDKLIWPHISEPSKEAKYLYGSKNFITDERGCSTITWTHLAMQSMTTNAHRIAILGLAAPETRIYNITSKYQVTWWSKPAHANNKPKITQCYPKIALARRTEGCCLSPITFCGLRTLVPLLIHTQLLHGGPEWAIPSSTILRHPWIKRRKPLLSTRVCRGRVTIKMLTGLGGHADKSRLSKHVGVCHIIIRTVANKWEQLTWQPRQLSYLRLQNVILHRTGLDVIVQSQFNPTKLLNQESSTSERTDHIMPLEILQQTINVYCFKSKRKIPLSCAQSQIELQIDFHVAADLRIWRFQADCTLVCK